MQVQRQSHSKVRLPNPECCVDYDCMKDLCSDHGFWSRPCCRLTAMRDCRPVNSFIPVTGNRTLQDEGKSSREPRGQSIESKEKGSSEEAVAEEEEAAVPLK